MTGSLMSYNENSKEKRILLSKGILADLLKTGNPVNSNY